MWAPPVSYPLHLDLVGKRVVVVGAGAVAARRIALLVEAQALVTVIAPEVHPDILEQASAGTVHVIERAYQAGDLQDAWLVHVATNDALVNAQVADHAAALQIWSVRADAADLSDAQTPAVGRVGDVTVSVTSGDPTRSVGYRNHIVAGLEQGILHERPKRSAATGSVVLIGAGPGDPELITLRGARALRDADVVVFDRLAPLSLLETMAPEVELIDASKSPGNHVLTQDEINEVIVTKAQQGKRVVRLKGGDPFVFGRGSEEVNACITAGISVEVVPGVTSAISAPSAAGIPVTHRGLSTGFVVISGHEIEDLRGVVASGLTTVVLMGVATLPKLVEQFLAHGSSPTLPVAIIEHAYSLNQKTLTSTLENVVADALAAAVSNPAVIVIGEVVNAIDSHDRINAVLVGASSRRADTSEVTTV